jgi:cellular nucleic acid-binding protein
LDDNRGGRFMDERRGRFNDIICRTCNEPGHTSRECTPILICHNCGGRGHVAYECPSGRVMLRDMRRR